MKPLATLRRNTTAAFTLLEIMLVVMIIALLATSAIYLMKGNLDIAKDTLVRSDLQLVLTQLQLYETVSGTGRPPTTAEGLKALMHPKRGPKLLPKIPVDPWGTELQYRYPATKSTTEDYDLFSAGPDRKPDTNDDIGNWVNANAAK